MLLLDEQHKEHQHGGSVQWTQEDRDAIVG